MNCCGSVETVLENYTDILILATNCIIINNHWKRFYNDQKIIGVDFTSELLNCALNAICTARKHFLTLNFPWL